MITLVSTINWPEVGAVCAVLALLGKLFLSSVKSVIRDEWEGHTEEMDKRYMSKTLAHEKFSSLQQQINIIRKEHV